jgi:hypothetical protein
VTMPMATGVGAVYLGLAADAHVDAAPRAGVWCRVASRRPSTWPTALRAAAGGGGRGTACRVGPGSAPGSGSPARPVPSDPPGVSGRGGAGVCRVRALSVSLSRPRGHAGHGAGHGPTVKLDHRTAAVAVAAPRDFNLYSNTVTRLSMKIDLT